jgi:hypothetical protein
MSKTGEYSPQTWALIQTLYETGKFKSLKRLHVHCSKILTECPTLSSIEKHCADDGWQKFGLKEHVEGEIRKTTIEKFAELGMPEERVFKLVIDGLTCGEAEIEKIGNIVAESVGRRLDVTGPEVAAALKKYTKSLELQRTYIDLWAKLTGKTAPIRMDHTSKGRQMGKAAGVIDPKDIPDDELRKRLKELSAEIEASISTDDEDD